MKSYRLLAALALTAWIAGCAMHSNDDQAKQDLAQARVVRASNAATGDQLGELPNSEARALMAGWAPYAAMADASYRHEFESATARLEHGCDYVGGNDQHVLTLNLPDGWWRLNRDMIKRWQLERDEKPSHPLIPCLSGKGLDFETYVRVENNRPVQAVIAFRGTENTRYQWREDWVANFSNVDFGLGSNKQFTGTRDEGTRLVHALAKELPKVEATEQCKLSGGAGNAQSPIDLTGHSLGGGLAQHLAYVSKPCEVRKTVTFDTSPANGWFYLHLNGAIITPDPAIERVYTDGEALSFVRKVSTRFYHVRRYRTDYRIDFPGVHGSPVALHSMGLLATRLRKDSGVPLDDESDRLVRYDDPKQYPQVANMKQTN